MARLIGGDDGGGGGYTTTTRTPGNLSVNQSKTGLSANTDYEVRLLLRKGVTADPTLSFGGPSTITGS
jgi:hypothetical protein